MTLQFQSRHGQQLWVSLAGSAAFVWLGALVADWLVDGGPHWGSMAVIAGVELLAWAAFGFRRDRNGLYLGDGRVWVVGPFGGDKLGTIDADHPPTMRVLTQREVSRIAVTDAYGAEYKVSWLLYMHQRRWMGFAEAREQRRPPRLPAPAPGELRTRPALRPDVGGARGCEPRGLPALELCHEGRCCPYVQRTARD